MTSKYVYEQEIVDEVDRNNLTQIKDCFTTKRDTLDLVFVNNPGNVDAPRKHREFMKSFVKSVDFPTIFTFCLPSTRHEYQSSPISSTIYSFNRCDYNMLKAFIIEQPYMPQCCNNSDQTKQLKNGMLGFL